MDVCSCGARAAGVDGAGGAGALPVVDAGSGGDLYPGAADEDRDLEHAVVVQGRGRDVLRGPGDVVHH